MAVSAFAVHAADTDFTAYCDHCQQEVTWTAISANGQAVTDGHYYLPKSGLVLGANTVASGKTVCLNLNGYYVIANKPLTVADGGSMYVQGKGSITARGNGTQALGGLIDLKSGGSLYMKDTTVTYQLLTDRVRDTVKGGILAVAGNATLENCTISGGRATEAGGNIYVTSTGTLKLIGGNISGGSIGKADGTADAAHASRCIYNDGKIILSGSASAELLRLSAAATLDIEGAYTGTVALHLDGTTSGGTVIGALAQGASITGAKFSVSNINVTIDTDGQKLVLKTGLANDNDDIHQEGFQAFCESCQKEVTWEQLKASTQIMTDGHYYLEGNLVSTGHVANSGKKICLNLNGCQYTANKPISVAKGGQLHIQNGEILARGNTLSNVVYGAIRVLSGGNASVKDVNFVWDTKDGRKVANGGYFYASGNITAENCTFTNGRAMEKGGNIYVTATGEVTLKDCAVIGGVIDTDDTATGRCIYSDGKVIISGNTSVELMQIGSDVALETALTIDGAYTGALNLYYTKTPAVGDTIGALTNGGDIAGAQISIVNAELEAAVSGTNLVAKLPPVAIVNGVRFDELADAVAAAGEYPLVLNRSVDQLTVNKGMLVDLNGCNVGTLTVDTQEPVQVMDSKTADYLINDGVYGKIAKIVGSVADAMVDGNAYIAIEEEGYTSFHALKIEINAVTLRAEGAAVYFNSNFLGDTKVKALVDSFGVALGVNGAPDSQAVRNNINCTVFTQEQFNAGAEITSSLVTGILKDTNNLRTNNRNAAMEIYGVPYLKMTDGTLIMGVPQSSSLLKILADVSGIWESLDYVQQDAVMDMYEEYAYVMAEWDIPVIANAVVEREEKTIRILTIGNSHGNDANWQLRYVFQQEDPSRRVVVGFLYYSGCSIERHVKYAQNNSPEYSYYKNEYGTLEKKSNATMLDALQDEPWDIVLLQEMNKPAGKEASFQNNNIDKLIDYVKANTTSDPKIGWHMVWTNPVTAQYWDEATRPTLLPDGWVEDYTRDYNLDQKYMYNLMTANVEKYVLTNDRIDPNYVFTSGTAVQYANDVLGYTDQDLYRDYTHISDFSRLMVSYLWYCKLTGTTLNSIEDIDIDVVPKALRQTRFQAEDLIVTDRMKETIMKAVNHTLENPLSVPERSFEEDPATDGDLNVLMIGNSFCYYYPDELVEMAKAVGKQLRICNVYYSGCKMSQHYNWYKRGDAKYTFYVRGTDGTFIKEDNVTLEYCLAQGNWDVISLQTISGASDETPEQRVASNKVYLDTLYGLLRTRFPQAKLAWHQTWAYQVGTASNGTVTTPEKQPANAAFGQATAHMISEMYNVDRINTGEAWWSIRNTGYDNLCARLGKKVDPAPMDSGDNYHDGDIGGGQYLNACVWYEYLFGLDVRENPFVPTYDRPGTTGVGTLNENGTGEYKLLIDQKLLQEAAHGAFTTGNVVELPVN